MQDSSTPDPDNAAPPPRWMEAGGWLGTLLILGAYAGSSLGWFEQGTLYQAMNLAGALGVGLICWRRRTWQAFALEAAWGTIALVALLQSGLG